MSASFFERLTRGLQGRSSGRNDPPVEDAVSRPEPRDAPERNDVDLTAVVGEQQTKIAGLRDTVQKKDEMLTNLASVVENQLSTITNLQAAQESLQKEVANLSSIAENQLSTIRHLEAERAAREQEGKLRERAARDRVATAEALEAELVVHQQQIENLSSIVENQLSTIRSLEASLETKSAGLANLEGHIANLESVIENQRGTAGSLKAQLAAARRELAEASEPDSEPTGPVDLARQFISSGRFIEFRRGLGSITGHKGTFVGDSLVSFGKMLGFTLDSDFRSAYQWALDRYEDKATFEVVKQVIWRTHVLGWAARNALGLDGDFVECGVAHGFSVDVLAKYLDFQEQERKWYLYDTFSGVPSDLREDRREYLDNYSLERIVRLFSAYPNIEIVKGRLPQVLEETSPQRISFLHLDLNNLRSEMATFLELFPRVVLGGYVVLDDYGWMLFARQHQGFARLFAHFGVPVLELPTGQGMIQKTKELDIESIDVDEFSNLPSSAAVGFWPPREPPDGELEAEVLRALEYREQRLEECDSLVKAVTAEDAAVPGLAPLREAFTRLSLLSVSWRVGRAKVTGVNTYFTSDWPFLRAEIQRDIDEIVGLAEQLRQLRDRARGTDG